MKVGILTMFNGLSKTYSLVNVVAEHIRMFLDNGIKVKLLVSQDCNYDEREGIFLDNRIEWEKVCNRYNGKQIHWFDYNNPSKPIHDTLIQESEEIGKDLINKLSDVDVCMMHDIFYQGWHLVHNLAVRYAQKQLKNIKFIAMTHSIPDTSQVDKIIDYPHIARYSPMENTIFAYPTECGLEALSKQYNVDINKCVAINNTLDLIEPMSDEIKKINSMVDLLSSDILIVYPARLTPAKQFEKIAQLGGAIKRYTGQSIKIVFCEFPSMDIDPKEYKDIIRKKGMNSGLELEDMVFISDLGYKSGLKREHVLELFTLSNLFVCPSFSESFGLTVLEAASRGNFIVLNQAVPALEEIGDIINAYYLRWDARNFFYDTIESYHPDEESYYRDNAINIINEMKNDRVIRAKIISRIRYSPKWVYENQLKPLIFN